MISRYHLILLVCLNLLELTSGVDNETTSGGAKKQYRGKAVKKSKTISVYNEREDQWNFEQELLERYGPELKNPLRWQELLDNLYEDTATFFHTCVSMSIIVYKNDRKEDDVPYCEGKPYRAEGHYRYWVHFHEHRPRKRVFTDILKCACGPKRKFFMIFHSESKYFILTPYDEAVEIRGIYSLPNITKQS